MLILIRILIRIKIRIYQKDRGKYVHKVANIILNEVRQLGLI